MKRGVVYQSRKLHPLLILGRNLLDETRNSIVLIEIVSRAGLNDLICRLALFLGGKLSCKNIAFGLVFFSFRRLFLRRTSIYRFSKAFIFSGKDSEDEKFFQYST